MAEQSRVKRKSKKHFIHEDSCILSVKKQKKLAPKITTVATKILVDDAYKGFKNGNFVCLPFSLKILLGMLAFGAEGETLKQLLEFLGHDPIDQLRSEYPSSKLFAQILSNPNDGEGCLDVSLVDGVCASWT